MHMPCLLTCGSQRAVRLPASFLLLHCFCVLHYSHPAFRAFGFLRCFRPYIWPQTPFVGKNHTNDDLSSIFAWIAAIKCWVFNFQVTAMFTLQRAAHSRGFGRRACDFRDVRGICKRAGCSGSLVGSSTLPLVGVKLSSQILVLVRKWIEFQALSN